MDKIIFYAASALAGFLAICPRGKKPPCPDPLAKSLLGLVMGVIAAIAYYFLFVGTRALECCDIIAVVLIAFLFSHFIWTLFFAKKEV
ncbi:MAG: hypothetical protein WAU81_13020 [Candidatus Aminicenantales bacterium]